MALFTDGISTIQDLINRDSSVLATAQSENIDLNQKMSLAQQEIGVELTTLLQRSNTYDWQFWLQPSPQLNNVVVTPPLQLWHVFHSLELVYEDAYHSQLNDRYQGKRDQFLQLVKWAADKLMQTGLGIVSDPIPQAAPPQMSSIPGGQPAMTYFASVSWLNVAGEEGLASIAGTLSVAGGNTLAVAPLNQPPNAIAWNVFVGPSADKLVLQNVAPLAANQMWLQAAPVSTTARGPGSGQAPNYLRALARVIQRG